MERRAQPKQRRGLPMNGLTNIWSSLMRAFFAPILETSSVVRAGVKASMAAEMGGASGWRWNGKQVSR